MEENVILAKFELGNVSKILLQGSHFVVFLEKILNSYSASLYPIAQRLGNFIQQLNRFVMDTADVNQTNHVIHWILDSDLSIGHHYPSFEKPGPCVFRNGYS